MGLFALMMMIQMNFHVVDSEGVSFQHAAVAVAVAVEFVGDGSWGAENVVSEILQRSCCCC